VAVAQAKPSLELTETGARTGDLVHFSISGLDGGVTYRLEVDDTEVLEDTGAGVVSGTFTMPDLGDPGRTVTVEAEIRGSGRLKKLQQDLEYLGPALPVTDAPAPAPGPAAPAVPEDAPPPVYSPSVVEKTSPASAVTPRSSHGRRRSRGRHGVKRPRHVPRSGEHRRRVHRGRDRRHHRVGVRKARSNHATAGASSPAGSVAEPARPVQHPPLEPTTPGPALLVPPGAGRIDGGHAALVVPGLLGLAALVLAGTVVMRRRRLASRRGRD
jgi:hypothetical protein